MAVGVSGVLKLLKDYCAGDRIAEFICLCDCALHSGRAGGEDDFCAICGGELAPLDAHRLRHGEDEVVTAHS